MSLALKWQKRALAKSLDEIIDILDEADDVDWRISFDRNRTQLLNADEEELVNFARMILRLSSGGMASFNDLVLSKEGKVDPMLCERLVRARKKLYKEALKIL